MTPFHSFPVQPPAADQHLRVGMLADVSAPGVQTGDHARQGAEVFLVSEQFFQGGDGGSEQGVGRQPVVVPPQVVQLVRQGEDGVVVVAGEQFGFDLFQPALGGQGRALGAGGVSAGVVPDLSTWPWGQRCTCPPSASVRHCMMAQAALILCGGCGWAFR